MKFQIRQFRRFDGGWGAIDEKGNWNGMISNLRNGEADIITTDLTICCRRTETVDFLWALAEGREAFAIKGWCLKMVF